MNRHPDFSTSHFFAGALFAMLLMFLPSLIWAQTGDITGRVLVTDTGEALSGAHVEVLSLDLKIKLSAMTDGEGRYTVHSVLTGTYTVKVTFVGYKEGEIKNVRVTKDQSVTADVRLIPVPYEMEQIVVSASRQAENILDAPVSISKVDRREIQDNAMATSLGSIVKHAKGIESTQTGLFTEAFNARGFNSAFNTRMLIVYDGYPVNQPSALTNSTPIPKDDIQNVEIIVGPGAALYGPNAVSGIISVTTLDPKDIHGTTVAVAGGSRSIFKTRFRHANTQGKWGWKVAGEYQQARDFENIKQYYNADSSVVVTDEPDFDTNTLRFNGGLFYYPTPDSRFRFTTGWSRVNLIDLVDTGRIQRGGGGLITLHLDYASPKIYVRFTGGRINNGNSVTLHSKAGYLLSGLSLSEATEKASFSGRSKEWGAEARYMDHFKNVGFQFGVDYRQGRSTKNPIIEGSPINVDQVGFYGHAETDLGKTLKLVLSVREDFHEDYDKQFSPRVAVIFKPRPETAFRFTFNRAFRSPSTVHRRLVLDIGPNARARGSRNGFTFGTEDGSPLPSEYEAGIPKIKPEQNTTLELGFKGVLSERIFLDISGSRSRYTDFISPLRRISDAGQGIVVRDENGNLRTGETTLTYINFGKRTVLALDLGLNVYATDQIVMKGNASFFKPGTLEDAAGITQPFNSSEATFNLGVLVKDVFAKGSFLDFSLRRVQEYDLRVGVHNGVVPTYTVVDANVGYRMPTGLVFRLTMQNILDNKHVEFVDGAELRRIAVAEIEYGF